MRRGVTIAAAGSLVCLASAAPADAPIEEENAEALKAEIKQRCQDSMGEYGDSMVLECMKQDWQAAQQIPDHRDSNPNTTERCLDSMRDYGFAMVLECIRQDASAQDEIEDW